MAAISTTGMITMVVGLITNMFDPFDFAATDLFSNSFLGDFCVTLTSWGADGFMLWRCAMLYQGISRPRWLALLSLIVFLALMSFVAGVIFLSGGIGIGFVTFISATIFLNLVTATLITVRILYYQRFIQKTVGLVGSSSPYTMVIVICLESSALIVVINVITLILAFGPFFQLWGLSLISIPMNLLVHIYVLSPLLIIYRVARGKTVTIKPSEGGPVVSALHFTSQPPQPSDDAV